MSKKELIRSLTMAAFVLVGASLIYNIANMQNGVLTTNILLIILTIVYCTTNELIHGDLLSSRVIDIIKRVVVVMVYVVLLLEVITYRI